MGAFASGSARNPTPLDLRIYAFNLFCGVFSIISPFKGKAVCQFTKSQACACHRRGAGGDHKASETSFGEWQNADLYQDKHTPGSQITIFHDKFTVEDINF